MMDQICSLMETTIRHKAGDRGLPMGLPLHWRTHFWPRANVCMLSADLMRSGTFLMMIFPGDIETTESASFDDVSWIVGLSRID